MKATLQNFKKGIWITHRLTGHQFFYQNGGYISKDGEKAILCHFITELGFEHEKTTYLFDECIVSTNTQPKQKRQSSLQCTGGQQAILLAIAERVMSGFIYDPLGEMYVLPTDYCITMDKRLYQQLAPLFDMEIPHFSTPQKP